MNVTSAFARGIVSEYVGNSREAVGRRMNTVVRVQADMHWAVGVEPEAIGIGQRRPGVMIVVRAGRRCCRRQSGVVRVSERRVPRRRTTGGRLVRRIVKRKAAVGQLVRASSDAELLLDSW